MHQPRHHPPPGNWKSVALRTGTTLALAAALSSCGAYRMTAPADPTLAKKTARTGRVAVFGYTTTDGQYHKFRGYLAVRGDSLIMTPRKKTSPRGDTIVGSDSVLTFSRDEVRSVKLHSGLSLARTALITVSVVAVLAGLGFLALALDPI